jgi:predicted component of type VI protein secretion system
MGVSMFGQPPSEAHLEIGIAGEVRRLQPRGEPITLGRSATADLPVNDSRVSRLHATIEWRGGHFVLGDASSFGTWVYFGNQREPVVLRRTECYLVGQGQIALGCDRNAEAAPLASFAVVV